MSVLIPARNEERSIQTSVEAALASAGVDELEVLVLDDHSDDATSAIVRRIAAVDSRVRLAEGPELPAGWCGKQHACWVLSQLASSEWLLFMDADAAPCPRRPGAHGRVSAPIRRRHGQRHPAQEAQTLLEQMVIPIIHFVLLGFLPIRRMCASRNPAYGAGCGQLFLAKKSSYIKAGGHASIRATMHDGIKLPRSFRAAGLMTDLCDATPVARCRMYSQRRRAFARLGEKRL